MARSISGERHLVHVGGAAIHFEIIFSARKTLAIMVYPDQRVVVKAPTNTPIDYLREMVAQRAGWIGKQRRRFETSPRATTREYISGEVYRLLGEPLELRVISAARKRVRRSSGLLMVETPAPLDRAAVGQQVERWYTAQAKRVFAERLDVCYARVAHWGLPKPALRLRAMKTRWGSLSAKGSMSLNRVLVQAPVDLIDYVILHELCHLREMNHQPPFYALLSALLPTWRADRQRLNQYPFTW